MFFNNIGKYLLVLAVLIGSLSVHAQGWFKKMLLANVPEPGTYSIVSDDAGMVHRIGLTLVPISINFGLPTSFNVGAQLNYLHPTVGLFHLGYMLSPYSGDRGPAPFGPKFDNGFEAEIGDFNEKELSATLFFSKKVRSHNYSVHLRSSRSIGNTRNVLEQLVEGTLHVAFGVRGGISMQDGSYIKMLEPINGHNLAGINRFDRNVFFLGIAKVSWGTMVIDHSKYNRCGGTELGTYFLDIMFAPDQNIKCLVNTAYPEAASFNSKTAIKRFPLGVRFGHMFQATYRTRSFMQLNNIEVGFRPSFLKQTNEFYVGIKIGFGSGIMRINRSSAKAGREERNNFNESNSSDKKGSTKNRMDDDFNDARKYQNKGSYKQGKKGRQIYVKPKNRFG